MLKLSVPNYYPVRVVKFNHPIGQVAHALLKCPRCLRGIGVTLPMLLGIDSIICKGELGKTGYVCNGHYYYERRRGVLRFVGTIK